MVITDAEYPIRPAFSLLQKVIDDFISTVPQASYNNADFPAITTYLTKYQDPKNADQIMRVQAELDETKIILVSSHTWGLVDSHVDLFHAAQDY